MGNIFSLLRRVLTNESHRNYIYYHYSFLLSLHAIYMHPFVCVCIFVFCLYFTYFILILCFFYIFLYLHAICVLLNKNETKNYFRSYIDRLHVLFIIISAPPSLLICSFIIVLMFGLVFIICVLHCVRVKFCYISKMLVT